MTKEIKKIIELNQQLINILILWTYELNKFSEKNNIDFPLEIQQYIRQLKRLVFEEDESLILMKQCPLCNKSNQKDAKYCMYCGSSLIIAQIK